MCGNKLILALDTRREIGTMSSGKGHENCTEDLTEHLRKKGTNRLMIWEKKKAEKRVMETMALERGGQERINGMIGGVY